MDNQTLQQALSTMDKRNFPQYKAELDKANKVLHNSNNKYARTLLGRITTLTDYADSIDTVNDMLKAHKDGTITDEEYDALSKLSGYVIADNVGLKFSEPHKDVPIMDVFRKRIWSNVDMSKVVQFRNCVTDMLMLEFITLEEYIDLSNEVDRYVQYTLSDGGIK